METKSSNLISVRDSILALTEPVYIFSHPHPDGDSIGSTIGLYYLLESRGIKAHPVFPGPIPTTLSSLAADVELLQPPIDVRGKNIVVLDCSDLKRLHQTGQRLEDAKLVINIDHHLNNDLFGDVNYVDPSAAAVGQILHNMFYGNGPYPIQAAQALFTALFTDTGRFSYGNTDSLALTAGAELVNLGAEPQVVFNSVFQSRSINYYQFLVQALDKISLSFDNRVALMVLEDKLLKQYSLEDWELDDLNDYPRSLRGVLVSGILKETAEGIRVSLRSKGNLDVAAVARYFGGGGHKNAAGVTMEMSLTEAIEAVKKRLEQEF